MRLFNPETQATLLHALNRELDQHDDRIQRALAGIAAFYVPNDNQREQLAREQQRLTSINVGVIALKKFWGKPELLPRHTDQQLGGTLLELAYTAVAIALAQAHVCQNPGAHPTYTRDELTGLRDLFCYLDAKVDAARLPIEKRIEYSTTGTDIGYVFTTKKFTVPR